MPAVASTAEAGFDPQEIVARIRAALPAGEARAALHEPRFGPRERAYVDDCIDTNWVSYAGAYVDRFEQALAARSGVGHAVAVVSGTVALQVALQIAGVQPGEEVLVPALTFVASANAVVHTGAVPHFVDADAATLGISVPALAKHLDAVGEMRGGKLFNRATGRRISAVLPVHIFGHPVDMDPLTALAERFGLIVIEDATESLGSSYKDRPCGSLAQLAVLSFNGNKIVTTGGGGAILTDDAALAKRLRHLTTTAKLPHRWAFVHDEIGYNFRLPNLNAALGVAQMERLDDMLAAKRRLWQRYRDAFSGMAGVEVFAPPAFAGSNHWLVALMLDDAHAGRLDDVLAATNDAGLMTRPVWTPMHQLSIYADHPRADLSVTENLARRILNVPSSPFLAP
ncbi:MAG TPA: LegC family aminotransferase [Xanthobacteraceae bacterium]|nr:LegC family aminotransferase [Xanthobacteraceae bacterium]